MNLLSIGAGPRNGWRVARSCVRAEIGAARPVRFQHVHDGDTLTLLVGKPFRFTVAMVLPINIRFHVCTGALGIERSAEGCRKRFAIWSGNA
jgi:hypothetical protein